MKKETYIKTEAYMLSCMKDGAHDRLHVYRVLYYALELAKDFCVDKDVLIAASLLHDIGRDAQFNDPECDHAAAGAAMAYQFLTETGWDKHKASHVRSCIATHRYRNSEAPKSTEAMILFDADKLDVTGMMGIARTLAYKGIVAEPLYSVDQNGFVLSGENDAAQSFFGEYCFKLKNVYGKFFTDRAKAIAEERQKASADFYEKMFGEVDFTHKNGIHLLKEAVTD